MLNVMPNNKYRVTVRAKTDTLRIGSALVVVNGGVMAIAGYNYSILPTHELNCQSIVSCHDLATNTWKVNLPKLNHPRFGASACFLANNVFVFCGRGLFYQMLNSIEKIKAV